MVFTAHLGYQTADSGIFLFSQYRRFPNTQMALNSVLKVIDDIILASKSQVPYHYIQVIECLMFGP